MTTSEKEAEWQDMQQRPSLEFVLLMAVLTAMVALSIDTMLPALGTIAADLGAPGENSRQYILFALFAGLSFGQLFYGPLSDSIGRKPAILLGLAIFSAGALLCLFAASFEVMLVGRAIQGFGASGPRIVSMAMVRDGQAGAAMARVMSLVMSIFIFVPIVAPSIGQLVLFVASWRAIFVGFFAIAVLAGLWLHVRQAETLPAARRRPMRLAALLRAAVTVMTHPVTMGYTLATGFVFGAFVSYLGMSQQIFAEQYDQGKLFAVYFGVLAVAIGLASIVNARLVMRFGMRNLTKLALRGAVVLSVFFLVYCFAAAGHPPLWTYMIYMFATFFFNGILFGNYNAMAMEPMGAIAGMAASVIGTLTSMVALVSGAVIAQLYDGTLLPLVGGFAVLGLGALCATESAEALKERR